MKKRILIISAVFPPEQVTSAFLNYDLAKALSRDYCVTILRPRPTRPIGTKFQAGWSDPNLETILVESYTHPKSELFGRLIESIDFGRRSVKYIRAHLNAIDYVYNDGWQLFGLYLVAKACKKKGIPYMVPIQDIYPESLFTGKSYPQIVKRIITLALLPFDVFYQKHALNVRTISKEMADYLSSTRHINRDKYLVVNNWQNDAEFLKEYPKRQEDGKTIFEYVGSINEHANVELMIRAFAESTVSNCELRIYGGGNKREDCINLIKDLGLTNVLFDFVSRERVPFVQSQADVLVLALPSGNGNLCLPSKLTSYMLSGKPVLASVDDDSSTKRIITNNHCGMSVSPDSVEALAHAMREFAEMTVEQRAEMGKSSRDYALAHLTRRVNLSLVVDKIHSFLD